MAVLVVSAVRLAVSSPHIPPLQMHVPRHRKASSQSGRQAVSLKIPGSLRYRHRQRQLVITADARDATTSFHGKGLLRLGYGVLVHMHIPMYVVYAEVSLASGCYFLYLVLLYGVFVYVNCKVIGLVVPYERNGMSHLAFVLCF